MAQDLTEADRATLRAERIQRIVSMYGDGPTKGGMSQDAIADQFGLARSVVADILKAAVGKRQPAETVDRPTVPIAITLAEKRQAEVSDRSVAPVLSSSRPTTPPAPAPRPTDEHEGGGRLGIAGSLQTERPEH